MRLFNRYVSTRSLTVFTGELFLIFGSVTLAASVQNTPDLAGSFWKIVLVTVVCQLCLYYNDFYDLTLVQFGRELHIKGEQLRQFPHLAVHRNIHALDKIRGGAAVLCEVGL